MRDLLILAGWLVGWVATARLLFVWGARQPPYGDEDGFAPTVIGLIWPVLLGVMIVLLPFLAVGWLISRPVRRR